MDFNDVNIEEVCKFYANTPPYGYIPRFEKFGISKSKATRIVNQLYPDWYPYHKESRYVLTRLVKDPEFEQRYREVCRKCLTGDVDDWIDNLKSIYAPEYPSLRKNKTIYPKSVNTVMWNIYTTN
jgi:hypothetical protein